MTEDRAIPAAIKRQVRQECGFGCVICGTPLFDYDHIVPFATVQEHKAENITLLCRSHHSDKTAGRLSTIRVKEARSSPINLKLDYSAPYKLTTDRSIRFNIGTNTVRGPLFAPIMVVWISGHTYFTLEADGGWVTFSCEITDRRGRLVLSVNRGEITATTKAWDYSWEGRRLRIWLGPRNVILDMDLSSDEIIIRNACFIDRHGDGIVVLPDRIQAIKSGAISGSYSQVIANTSHRGNYVVFGIANESVIPRAMYEHLQMALSEIYTPD